MLLTVLFDTAELQNIKEQLSKPQNTAAYRIVQSQQDFTVLRRAE